MSKVWDVPAVGETPKTVLETVDPQGESRMWASQNRGQ